MQLVPPRNPNLPYAPGAYDAGYHERQNSILRQYFNTLDGLFRQVLRGFNNYGTFIDTTLQTPAVINTAYPITLNTTIEAFGISRGTPTSRIQVTVAGVYRFAFSVQLNNGGGSVVNTWFWFRKNGVDIANTASHIVLNGPNSSQVPLLEYLVTMEAGTYIELVWAADSLNAQVHYVAPAAPVPAVPSVILTATYVYPDATT